MDFMKEYEFWSTDPYFDEGTRNELIAIKDDKKEIEDRFYRDLEFGTAGLRGVLGAGTNRMNVYTVAKASEGLSKYILSEGEEAVKRGVVISYDSRHFSPEFAQITAQVLAANGIRIVRVDGNGILRTGNGIGVFLVHELCRSQCVPIVL